MRAVFMHLARIAGVIVVALPSVPILPAAADSTQARANCTPTEQLLRVTNEMWLLLSSIVDRESAEQKALRFNNLVHESAELSDKMFAGEAQALNVDALDHDAYRVAEAYEELCREFSALCQVQCYGSARLIKAFEEAMTLGVFSDEERGALYTTTRMLTRQEARKELSRLDSMYTEDEQILAALTRVKTPIDAAEQARVLAGIAEKILTKKQPKLQLTAANFPAEMQKELHRICGKVEPALWRIRSEIVRIVALPEYDGPKYDAFADALDAIYTALSKSHAECFDDIFDASFRTDLDDVMHDQSGTNNPDTQHADE